MRSSEASSTPPETKDTGPERCTCSSALAPANGNKVAAPKNTATSALRVGCQLRDWKLRVFIRDLLRVECALLLDAHFVVDALHAFRAAGNGDGAIRLGFVI